MKKQTLLNFFLFLLLILFLELLHLQQPKDSQLVQAFTTDSSRTCTGPKDSTVSMLVVTHQFKSLDARIACRDNSNCEGTDPAGLVGQILPARLIIPPLVPLPGVVQLKLLRTNQKVLVLLRLLLLIVPFTSLTV